MWNAPHRQSCTAAHEAQVAAIVYGAFPLLAVALRALFARFVWAFFIHSEAQMENSKSAAQNRKKPRGRPFEPGNNANPGGRPKLPPDVVHVRELARQYTDQAVETLARVMATGSPNAQVSAANALIDRGWGKAEQPITGPDNGAFKFEVTGLSWLQPTIQIRNGG